MDFAESTTSPMSIIDRYIFREILKIFLAVLAILLLVLFANTFIRFLGSVAEGAISNAVVLKLVGLEMSRLSGVLIPPAYFVATLFTLGRMYRDNEMMILCASGVGPWQVFRAVAIGGVVLALLVGWLVMSILPRATLAIELIKKNQEDAAALVGLGAGRFNEFENGELVAYLGELSEENGAIDDVFVQSTKGGMPGVVTAASGRLLTNQDGGDSVIVLKDGYRYQGIPGVTDFDIGHFAEYRIRLRRSPNDAYAEMRARPTLELIGMASPYAAAELQYRLSFPISILVFTILSIPLSRSVPRRSMYGRLLIALLVYFIYMNLQKTAENWIKDGVVPPWLGMWWVHALFILFAMLLMLRDSGRVRRWLRNFRASPA